jgi:hypothetical protein
MYLRLQIWQSRSEGSEHEGFGSIKEKDTPQSQAVTSVRGPEIMGTEVTKPRRPGIG